MIAGIGTDLVENKRLEKACLRDSFMKYCFTEKEQELIQSNVKKAAGNFAVKEAVSKAFGTGFRHIKVTDIEVLRDELGKPYVNLYGAALEKAKELKITTIHVSISNTSLYTVAYVIAEKESKQGV